MLTVIVLTVAISQLKNFSGQEIIACKALFLSIPIMFGLILFVICPNHTVYPRYFFLIKPAIWIGLALSVTQNQSRTLKTAFSGLTIVLIVLSFPQLKGAVSHNGTPNYRVGAGAKYLATVIKPEETVACFPAIYSACSPIL